MKVCKNNEFGRSMVEMLGVLAIIGVLSVGSIAGYSKAMLKYKLNKQAQQINQIISTGLRYAGKWNFKESTELVPYFVKLGEIPKEMIRANNSTGIYDVFGTNIRLTYIPNSKWTNIYLFPTNQDDQYSLEVCRNIIKTAKEFGDELYSLGALSGTGNGENSYDTTTQYSGKNCTTKGRCIKDLTLDKIDELCKNNIGNNWNAHIKIVYPE